MTKFPSTSLYFPVFMTPFFQQLIMSSNCIIWQVKLSQEEMTAVQSLQGRMIKNI
ncbi:hypothetical protein CDL12_22053 [Handroanthus impetiginosus]|uniref:Uncharacterized protein n=1 Tax=Handroanthus impetiginosus TaxID=429701 RepID=A0A2G9GJH7_9LAMI|nr:hypothetical protein CDL12_22053 [Handroanthus impetiginosus]